MTPSAPTQSLLDQTFPRTLFEWVDRLGQPALRGAQVEGWLFEGAPARRAAEQRLAAVGVTARFRSAYKPLVHYFLEEVDAAQLAAATVRYPMHATGSPGRFLLEAYPLADMLAGCDVQFEPGADDLHYDVALRFRDGRETTARVFSPNRMHADPTAPEPLLSPTGWLRVIPARGANGVGDGHGASGAAGVEASGLSRDGAEPTDFEALFAQAMRTLQQHPWPAQEPYFERLDILVDLPGFEQPLPLPDECMSLHEALHEDLYFSLLEFFQQHSGRPAGDRRLQPGQIVPDVRHHGVDPRVRIVLRAFDVAAQDASGWTDTTAGQALADMGQAPPPARIAQAMEAMGGQRFTATSRQGRTVLGLYRPGTDAPVLISGGQHANETSGVVGALRAAEVLHARPGAHFALIALENPDGFALHRELGAHHAHHMHHAARYSALGDDIEYRETAPLYEREARERGLAMSGAQLHINLHGYPAHEWTRPLSGYVPRGFGLWTVPKGFFLILRHHPGWQREGRELLERVSAALLAVPGLPEYNARQMALYERHAGALPFEVIHGTACTQSENPRGAPVTLITEFPDETVSGDAFRFAHTVQQAAVLAAVQAWQHIASARA
ncbi:peptidase M14 [Acidovorax sp. SUPP3334]|uniref:peptidase M14 n=1 Tax=Acidovorax sp. SUPP3334 TaxID=2920881 RepID=UPI0023DE271A|nr:peptidase M14 [Acidovorax sp. SUPP3334]GKT24653.1 peptidase M14 [Acidovorax sp. SUPP3334]